MGVKDKVPSSPNKEKQSPENNNNFNSMNSKRTYEEFKQSAELDNSNFSFDDSDSFSEDEEEKNGSSYEIYEQIDCRDKENRWLNAEIISVKI